MEISNSASTTKRTHVARFKVWEGKDVIRQGRAMIGATNPLDAAPGTIRGQYCQVVGK